MAAVTTIQIVDPDSPAVSVDERLNFADSEWQFGLTALQRELKALQATVRKGTVIVRVDDGSGQASGSVVVASNAAVGAGDTVTVGTEVLTVAASPATQNEWAAGANAGATADNLAAAINAHTDLQGVVTASSDGTDTVAVTAVPYGPIGNQLNLATSDATAFTVTAMSGASTTEETTTRTWAIGV